MVLWLKINASLKVTIQDLEFVLRQSSIKLYLIVHLAAVGTEST